jgi:hypothetical protein
MEYGWKMSGWGRISLLVGVGVLLGAGCGGRTGALEGDFSEGADGAGAEAGAISHGGTTSVAGRSSRGGRGNVAGSVAVGGYGGTVVYPGGGYGGTVVYPGGAYGAGGGYSFGGTYAFGGAYPGGGYGGYYPPVGGSYPVGGYTYGGYGGQGQDACGQCLLRACSPPLSQCLQDFGCIAILSCMQSNGCQAFECYSDAYCRGVIDQWGGPAGQSMNELLQTFSCAVQAGCPCN